MNFVELVKQEMERRGWSESELAREAGLSRQAVNFLLSGRTKSPSIDTINNIARAFRLPVDEFARAAGLLPKVTYRESLIKRIEEKASQLTDPKDIERVEKFIDLLSGDDVKRRKRTSRASGAASSRS